MNVDKAELRRDFERNIKKQSMTLLHPKVGIELLDHLERAETLLEQITVASKCQDCKIVEAAKPFTTTATQINLDQYAVDAGHLCKLCLALDELDKVSVNG